MEGDDDDVVYIDDDDSSGPTSVVNVKVNNIRPQYDNLKEWMEDPENAYIGRRGIVFVKKPDGSTERWPKQDSRWCNPFVVGKDGTREEVIAKFEEYLNLLFIEHPAEFKQLKKLKGKTLGCWCKPEACHGDVIKRFLDNDQGQYSDTESEGEY